jgi:hypothetical protein
MSRDSAPPILMRWTGEEFQPLDRFRKRCDEQYVVGEIYTIEAVPPRSQSSHKHYFAVIKAAWMNLPERYADQFQKPDDLRIYALFKLNMVTEERLPCSSNKQALAFIKFSGKPRENQILNVDGSVVIRYTAKSQSAKAMGNKEFQESKDAVLGFLSDMIGVDVTTLLKASA